MEPWKFDAKVQQLFEICKFHNTKTYFLQEKRAFACIYAKKVVILQRKMCVTQNTDYGGSSKSNHIELS